MTLRQVQTTDSEAKIKLDMDVRRKISKDRSDEILYCNVLGLCVTYLYEQSQELNLFQKSKTVHDAKLFNLS